MDVEQSGQRGELPMVTDGPASGQRDVANNSDKDEEDNMDTSLEIHHTNDNHTSADGNTADNITNHNTRNSETDTHVHLRSGASEWFSFPPASAPEPEQDDDIYH